MRVTLPALMHDVQAFTRRGVPSTNARTRWMFGFHRRLFRLCENVTDLPNQGPLPQMSQLAAMVRRGYQTPSVALASIALAIAQDAAVALVSPACKVADERSPGTASTCEPVAS
jgi:hypothetical protein